jgi:ThiF family
MKKLSPEKIDRMSLGLMQQNNCSLDEAQNIQSNLILFLKAGESLKSSCALQAAFVTALNSAQRAFKGGVQYELPDQTPNLLPQSKFKTLNEYIFLNFGSSSGYETNPNFTLVFGLHAKDESQLEIICNGWQAGVAVTGDQIEFEEKNDFALGGIAAGSLGVALSFMKVTGIDPYCTDFSTGISLWNPNVHWLDKDAFGPSTFNLPNKFWILGLGHLGQAYLWGLAMMPFADAGQVKITLQDYDKIEEANLGTGLLSKISDIGKLKTEVCHSWLSEAGFSSSVVNYAFNSNNLVPDLDVIALCGFDNAKGRSSLEDVSFKFIVEAALGNTVLDFDKIHFHSFPNSIKKAKDIWLHLSNLQEDLNPEILKQFDDNADKCGVQVIAGKAVSTSFVGAFTSSLLIAEIIRRENSGLSIASGSFQLRRLKKSTVQLSSQLSLNEKLVKD